MKNKFIVIDNYDSFIYNIVQYLKELGAEVEIFKNNKVTIAELKKMNFSSLIISPGPKNPSQAGISLDVIKEFYKTKKILGVCLGHQCIGQFFGCKIVKAEEPVHGKVSNIYFKEDSIFEGIEQGFEATRYHSLIVESDSISDCIKPLAFTDIITQKNDLVSLVKLVNSSSFTYSDFKILMALKHRDFPVYGVQFHPEAILTQYGKKLLSNFMSL